MSQISNKEQFRLVGHLQVTDVPLLSLYTDISDGTLYLTLRAYDDKEAYIIKQVLPQTVLDYMDCRRGLLNIFTDGVGYIFYRTSKEKISHKRFGQLDDAQMRDRLKSFAPFDTYDEILGFDEVKARHFISQGVSLLRS